MELHTNCVQMVTLQDPIPALDWLTVSRKHRKPSKREIKSVLKFLASNGGRKGGKARWKDMSPKERSAFMRRAALKRWSQEKEKRPPSAS
jgi:hypothetical protein